MKKLITTPLIILLIISCESDLNMLGTLTVDTEITTDYLLEGNLDIYLESQQKIRYKGKPGTQIIPIGLENLEDYEDCFVLYIASGSESAGNVSSAIVKIDGQKILNTSDFSKEYVVFSFEICYISPYSQMELEIRGEPGSYLDIWIEGKIKLTCPEGTFIDERDGEEYRYVCIGDQIWMAENLKATEYSDGTPIPLLTDNSEWIQDTDGAYCWYNNDESTYKNIYGALYNFHAVEDSKGLCPTGWHVPSYDEWMTLIDYLGGAWVAADKLKEAGITHWMPPNEGATNESGFTGLPGGDRDNDGLYNYLGIWGQWWTSSRYESNVWGWFFGLYFSSSGTTMSYVPPQFGYSVRCVKD